MLLPQVESIVCYDPTHRVPLWAAYRLTRADLASLARRDVFRTDPRLTPLESATCDDYAGSGYDRGHVVPSADMNRSRAAQANAYFLTNIAPQSPALNRGLWRWLEALVRRYADRYGTVHVLTGTVILEPVRTVPSGNVTVPARFYKVLVRTEPDGSLAALAIVLPNLTRGLPLPPGTGGVPGEKISREAADAYLAGHTVSIREVDTLTGVDLLPGLDAEDLKRAVASELWPRN